MDSFPWAWAFFSVYLVFTAVLAWRGGQKTGGTDSFAIGDGQMSPWVAGTTLGACLASSSMFVIMPGFVYADGLSALIGFSLPLIAGLAFGLLVLGPRFQDIGATAGALTIPHWLGARYRSDTLRRTYSFRNGQPEPPRLIFRCPSPVKMLVKLGGPETLTWRQVPGGSA